MVFNKNVERKQIEKFENDNLEKISGSAMFVFLKNELTKKKLSCKINIKKYHSELTINIFNEDGDRVSEYDEPNCSLMLCETICFIHNGRVIGVDLLTDKEFIESLELLIKQVKEYS